MCVERFLLREFLEFNSRLAPIHSCYALLGANFQQNLCTKFSVFQIFIYAFRLPFSSLLFMQNLHVVWENLSLQIGGWPLTSQDSPCGIWMRMHLDLMPLVDGVCPVDWEQARFGTQNTSTSQEFPHSKDASSAKWKELYCIALLGDITERSFPA